MSYKSIVVGLLAVLVAAQGMAVTLAPQDVEVALKQWQAAPFWTPTAPQPEAAAGRDSVQTTNILTTPMPYVAIAPAARQQLLSQLVSSVVPLIR